MEDINERLAKIKGILYLAHLTLAEYTTDDQIHASIDGAIEFAMSEIEKIQE